MAEWEVMPPLSVTMPLTLWWSISAVMEGVRSPTTKIVSWGRCFRSTGFTPTKSSNRFRLISSTSVAPLPGILVLGTLEHPFEQIEDRFRGSFRRLSPVDIGLDLLDQKWIAEHGDVASDNFRIPRVQRLLQLLRQALCIADATVNGPVQAGLLLFRVRSRTGFICDVLLLYDNGASNPNSL